MAWCCQATSHYLNQCWQSSVMPYGVTRSQIFWEFSIISLWWRVIGTYSAWCKTEASLSYTINCMVADDLAMQGTKTSAASNGIVLLCLEYSYFSTCYVDMANTLTRRQDGCHFPDDMFKCIFLTENMWISIEFSLKFLCMGPINNIATLVQIMAWHCPGDKPFPEPVVVSLLTHVCVTWPQWVKWLQTCHDAFCHLSGYVYDMSRKSFATVWKPAVL